MCDFCKDLVECPVGQKRKAVLCDYIENGEMGQMEVVVDHYRDHKNAFIHAGYVEANGRWRNMSAKIERCPFCGTKINSRLTANDNVTGMKREG